MKRLKLGLLLAASLVALSACACRPGHIGPYGGIHPGGCYVY
jgi:hypothetical protein